MREKGFTSSSDVSFSDLEVVKTIFQTLPLPMIIIDRHENIIFLNDAYRSYLHVSDRDFLGHNVREFISNSRLPMVLHTKKPLFGVYHHFVDAHSKNLEAICNLIPVIENGEAVACFGIIVFQNMSDLFSLTIQNEQLKKDLEYYKDELKSLQGAKYSIDNIIGQSSAVQRMKDEIYKLSETQSAVLITGESGSGKELVAHAIHQYSTRNAFPFISVNCAAIPENLWEAEMFGYTEGAFTGARRGGAMGKFEAANHGSIFLDEIGELPLIAQAKLLRVLQEKEITRVGGNAAIPVDVRILSATNSDLKQMVRDGRFRQDLYYRINILNIQVPALRERTGDIDVLLEHFLEQLYRAQGRKKSLSEKARVILTQYSWPGNIRELSNVVEKMYYMSDTDTIEVQDIPPQIFQQSISAAVKKGGGPGPGLDDLLGRFEEELALEALSQCGSNLSKAAALLQISRPRLYRILARQKEHPSAPII